MKPTSLLVTLGGTSSLQYAARWSADGDVILAGAPSWEEVAGAEAKKKTETKRSLTRFWKNFS